MVVVNKFTWSPVCSKKKLKTLLINKRKTLTETSKELGCSEKIVDHLIKKYNIHTKSWYPDKERLEDLYIKDKHTQKEIADICRVGVHVVERLMNKFNIKRRIAYKRNQYGKNNTSYKNGRQIKEGYIYILNNGKYKSHSAGRYIAEHIALMEIKIGRPLKYYGYNKSKNETIHHINENKQDNRLKNLKLWTHGEHMAWHSKQRGLKRRGLIK